MTEPAITNIRASITGEGAGERSRILIEATGTFRYSLTALSPTSGSIHISGAVLGAPEEDIAVDDGLISRLAIRRVGPEEAVVDIQLELPAPVEASTEPGLPFGLAVTFPRPAAYRWLAGKYILIDPGHGGRDTGGRGPINLLEKNLTLKIARQVHQYLLGYGANSTLTRASDGNVPGVRRFGPVALGRMELVLLVHLGVEKKGTRGVRTVFRTQGAHDLAAAVNSRLVRKTGFPNRGVVGDSSLPPALRRALKFRGPVPVIEIEPACISDQLDEGWLRSPVFIEKVALATVNGLRDFYAACEGKRASS